MLARGRSTAPLPFLVMTSHATHAETEAFFEENDYFGLPPDDVFFFRQGTMPALDLATGKLLMESPGRLFPSPNGHGGTLTALADSGLLDQLGHRGVRHVFYFQVDNPLVKIADPTFLGQHVRARAEVSSKVIPKDGPTDKLGNLVLVDGRCRSSSIPTCRRSWPRPATRPATCGSGPAVRRFTFSISSSWSG